MLCCVCLLENSNILSIFDDRGQKLKVSEIIGKHLWFEPQVDDILTTQICRVCWNKLDEFHTFYQAVEQNHKEYEQQVASSNVKTEIIETDPIKCEEEYIEVYNNIEIVPDPDPEENVDIKNPFEENEFDDNSMNNDYDEELKSSDEYEPSTSREQESSFADEELQSDDEEEEDNSICMENEVRKIDKTKDEIKRRKINLAVHVDEIIRKYIPMNCNLCVFAGTTFPDIVAHFKSDHPKIRPYVMCCDLKLSRRSYFAQHALKHQNPDCFKCKECNKTCTTIYGLRYHKKKYHPTNEDLIYACDSCPKKFVRKYLLESHKISHIPKEEWHYICEICPNKKSFASASLLTAHTNNIHKKEANICPVCAKEIKNKTCYDKHVRLHYEGSGPRVKCPFPDCDSWLKDKFNLKQHLARHNPEGIIYKCDECGRVCKSRRNLTDHKRTAHTITKTYQCEQCDKIFKKSTSLKEHMANHTGEVLYKCSFCTRTFNSSANMHAHNKRQHPIEYEERRKNKLIHSKNSFGRIGENSMELNDNFSSL